MKLDQGDRVDRYEVERLLGAGGTAMVYRVRHTSLGTQHALKLLTISGDSIRRRMMQEGRAQATLAHMNIVAVTDILSIEGQPGLLMEYIEGPTLEDALADHVLTLRDAETLFRGVLSGVRAAHRQGIIHRDLKPANVMLDPTPDGYVPKVTDFGLAKAISSGPNEVGSTRQGVAMGTPSYMAPEQIRDAGNVDQRADIFSLGCVLYELLARQRAFGGDDVLEIYTRIAQNHYQPIRTVVPDLPERFVQAIQGCLQSDRSHRIPDCDTLEEVLLGLRTWRWAREPTPPPDLRPPPTLRSDAPPLTLAPRAVDGGTPAPMPRMQAPPAVVRPQPSRSNNWVAAGMVGVALGLLLLSLLVAAVGIVVPLLVEARSPVRTTVEVVAPPIPIPARPVPVEPQPEVAPIVDPPPDVAPEVREIRPAPPTPIEIKVASAPMLAAIYVDGVFAKKKTPNKLELTPGPHTIELRSDDGTGTFEVNAGPGTPTSHCFAFATGTHHLGKCP